MADIRKNIICTYCGATYHIKYPDDNPPAQFCCFCSEEMQGIEDEDDDGDLDYCDDERDEF